jgi:leucyl aminopeptidase
MIQAVMQHLGMANAAYQAKAMVKPQTEIRFAASVSPQPLSARFGTYDVFTKNMGVSAQRQRVDIFTPTTAPKTARIVMVPSGTEFSFVPQLATLSAEEQPKVFAGLQKLLSAFAGQEGKDAQGNLLAYFKVGKAPAKPPKDKAVKQVETQPNPATEIKKADAPKPKLDAGATLKAMADALQKQLDELPADTEKVTVVLPEGLPTSLNREKILSRLAEQAVLNSYNPYVFKKEGHPSKLESIEFSAPGLNDITIAKALREGRLLAEGQNFARHLVDSPANIKTTQWIGEKARTLATNTLKVEVRDKQWIEQGNGRNMGLLLSVAQGNQPNTPAKEPRMVEMVYTPADGKFEKTLMLVGKGIIFDTGGNNLKTSEFIHNMHGDMAGAAAVMGAMKAIDDLKLQGIRVVGLAPLTENRMGSGATLPHDIYTARNGKTVAIDNTDAEGRLILADAIDYGLETYKPDGLATIATLTGGKVRGLGAQNCVALMGNNPDLVKQMEKISKGLGRSTANIPLSENHIKWVTRDGKGKAHAFNSVGMAEAKLFNVIKEEFNRENKAHSLQHSAQGGAFLFWNVKNGNGNPKTPGVHLDIAGAEFSEKDPKKGNAEFATGFGVTDLVGLAQGVSTGTIVLSEAKTTL